jgi:hypothetical protein
MTIFKTFGGILMKKEIKLAITSFGNENIFF